MTDQEPKEVPLVRGAPRAPVRTCVGCRSARPQDELRRLVRTPQGVRFDPMCRLPGRGAYLCPDPTCLARASRRDAEALRRALRGASLAEVRRALEDMRNDLVDQVPQAP